MSLLDQLLRKPEPTWFENTSGRRGTFEGVTISGGKRVRVLGTTLAREGLAFVSEVRLRGSEMPLTFTIRLRQIPSRVRIIKSDLMQAPKSILHRYYCSFTAIAADDWDAVVRYVDDLPEPVVTRTAPPPDDAYRSLSSSVLAAVVDHLVRLKRLAPVASGVAPLLRLHPGPVYELADGRTGRDVRIHSRIVSSSETRAYDTRFRIFSDDSVELLA
jgi:hypothetical protein